jgi:hypothetical protein
MTRKYFLILFVLVLAVGQSGAEQASITADKESVGKMATKELSGMSIVGNDEAPKSLYIVPWKSSELGQETSMNMMLNERDVPVDREVFMRQLEFYEVSTAQLEDYQ